MGAVNHITNSISSALGTDGSGGGIVGGVEKLGQSIASNPWMSAGLQLAGQAFGGPLGLGAVTALEDRARGQSIGNSLTGGLEAGGLSYLMNPSGGLTGRKAPTVGLSITPNTSTNLGGGVSQISKDAATNPYSLTDGGGISNDGSGGLSVTSSTPTSALGNVGSSTASSTTSPSGSFTTQNGLQALNAINSIAGGNNFQNNASNWANNQDPMAPYRAGYASQLASLMQNPGSITTMPGYQAGEISTQRSLASMGLLSSGAGEVAMQEYGGDFFNNEVSQLSKLATLGSAGGQAGATALDAQSLNLKGQNSVFANLASNPNINQIGSNLYNDASAIGSDISSGFNQLVNWFS
jgi:hypothetical protein